MCEYVCVNDKAGDLRSLAWVYVWIVAVFTAKANTGGVDLKGKMSPFVCTTCRDESASQGNTVPERVPCIQGDFNRA